MRVLVLALCAGLATALPTAYDAVAHNEVGTSKVFKSSSLTETESSHVSKESSYFYSDGETIIEITVAQAPEYNLVCMPSKELVQSAQFIVQETVDQEAVAAAASAAASGAAASAAAGGGGGGGGGAASSAAVGGEAGGVGGAASSAASGGGGGGGGAASSAAAGDSAASSAAAGGGGGGGGGAASSAAGGGGGGGGGAASSAAAGDSAASSAAAGGGGGGGGGAASSAAAGGGAGGVGGAASSAAAGDSAASSAAAGDSAASSAAGGGGGGGGGAASSAAAGDSAASSAAGGGGGGVGGAASSAAAGDSASSSAAAGDSAASSAAGGGGGGGGGAASSAAAGGSAASSAASGGGTSASASGGAGAVAVDSTPAAIYVASYDVVDDLTKCTCVQFYLCKEENIVSDGAGQIDIRFGAGSDPVNSKCSVVTDVCCLRPELQPLPHIVAEIQAEPYVPSCGKRNPDGLGFEIGGFKDSESQFGEYPWMAIIMEEEYSDSGVSHRYVCGGSLIAKGVILTAGHCIFGKDVSKLVVRLGDWDTKSLTELLPFYEYRVARTVVHEKFNQRSLFNTVALMFLKTEVTFQPHVDTICLPELSDLDHVFYDASHCIATGFGREQFDGGEYQNVMKQVNLKEVDHKTCQDRLRKTRLGRWFRLSKSFTCAGGEPGVDTCRGDGGSPLVCPLISNPSKYVQVGIVAWGIGCGQGGVPGVYASVQNLLPWIREHLAAEPGHTVEELVEVHEGVQVCITKNPLTQYHREEIQIQVGPVPDPHPPQVHPQPPSGGY